MKTSRLVDAERNTVYTLGNFGDICIHGTQGDLSHWKFLQLIDVCRCRWLYTLFSFFQQILEWIMDDWNVWTLWNVCVSFNCWSYRLALSM